MDTKSTYIFVYQTICEVNGKSYIGVHKTKRLNDGYIGCGVISDRSALRARGTMFQKAVSKYGYKSFRMYILDFFDTYEEAIREERLLVTKDWILSDCNYNAAVGGKGGYIHTDESKRKISLKHTGRKFSDERRRQMSLDRSGKKHGPCKEETKIKIAAANTGKKASASHIQSMSDNNARYWKGRERSELTKRKLSIAHTGKVLTADHRKKLSESHIGQVSTQRKNIEQYLGGLLISEYESISAAAKSIGCLNTSISNNLSGRTKACSGFTFKYKEVSSVS